MKLRAFTSDTRGAAAIEYGLVIALVSIAILVAVASVSGSLGEVWDWIRSQTAA